MQAERYTLEMFVVSVVFYGFITFEQAHCSLSSSLLMYYTVTVCHVRILSAPLFNQRKTTLGVTVRFETITNLFSGGTRKQPNSFVDVIYKPENKIT